MSTSVRFGSLALVAALAPMAVLASGCDSAREFKDGLESYANLVEACDNSTKLRDDQYKKVQDAMAKLSLAKPGDRAALRSFRDVARTEFTALHSGLKDQVAKADEKEVKDALTQFDAEVTRWAASPEAWIKLDSAKRAAASAGLDKMCKDAK